MNPLEKQDFLTQVCRLAGIPPENVVGGTMDVQVVHINKHTSVKFASGSIQCQTEANGVIHAYFSSTLICPICRTTIYASGGHPSHPDQNAMVGFTHCECKRLYCQNCLKQQLVTQCAYCKGSLCTQCSVWEQNAHGNLIRLHAGCQRDYAALREWHLQTRLDQRKRREIDFHES